MSRIAAEVARRHADAIEVRAGRRSRSLIERARCALRGHLWIHANNPARNPFKRFCVNCLAFEEWPPTRPPPR